MSDSTVGERIPEKLKFAKHTFKQAKNFLHPSLFTCDFKVINMDGHESNKFAMFMILPISGRDMAYQELIVDLARYHAAVFK